jgi:hypothetical protein
LITFVFTVFCLHLIPNMVAKQYKYLNLHQSVLVFEGKLSKVLFSDHNCCIIDICVADTISIRLILYHTHTEKFLLELPSMQHINWWPEMDYL